MSDTAHGPSTVLVTGAAGFIGSALCRTLLASGRRVVGYDDLSRGRRESTVSRMRDPGNTRRATGWAPGFSLDESLSDLVAFYGLSAGAPAEAAPQPPVSHPEGA